MTTKKTARADYMMSCPVCRKKLWASKVERHRKGKHPELTLPEFEKMIVDAIKSGKIRPKYYESTVKGLESGTQKVNRAKPKSKYGVGKIIQGGKVSPR